MKEIQIRDLGEGRAESWLARIVRWCRGRFPAAEPALDRSEIIQRNHTLFSKMPKLDQLRATALFQHQLGYVKMGSDPVSGAETDGSGESSGGFSVDK